MKALTVTEFIEQINDLLSANDQFSVEGEVSSFKIKDGKWVLFDLKDKGSVVSCFMTAWQLKTQIEDGMQVIVKGTPALKNWGQFSFNIKEIQPSGEGALKRAYELLKKKLDQEGLFDLDRKRDLPTFPQHVALITSRDAAAYADFIKVLNGRQGGLTVSFVHTQVQGGPAAEQIVSAIETANTELTNLDAIVLVRGGGSIEDLQSFNDERVVRAVAGSRHPMVVGVGHERDITLADMAADVRASTPSNAAELLVKSRELLNQEIGSLRDRLKSGIYEQLETQQSVLRQLVIILRGEVKMMKQGLEQLERVLKSLSPQGILKRGYSITKNEKGQVLKKGSQIKEGAKIVTQLYEGAITSKVTSAK
jgi:exodeoxyribonuclease VII large subunit